jgi:hypothetical protein
MTFKPTVGWAVICRVIPTAVRHRFLPLGEVVASFRGEREPLLLVGAQRSDDTAHGARYGFLRPKEIGFSPLAPPS